MVSAPSFDPADPPEIQDGDPRYEGVYLNRFLSSTFTPGSVFKTVTLTAALEQLPDLFQRTFTCTGSTVVGGETITCPFAHGEMDINDAFASSCNGVFAQLADELGAETIASTQSRPVCWTATPSAVSPPPPAVWNWRAPPPPSWAGPAWASITTWSTPVP